MEMEREMGRRHDLAKGTDRQMHRRVKGRQDGRRGESFRGENPMAGQKRAIQVDDTMPLFAEQLPRDDASHPPRAKCHVPARFRAALATLCLGLVRSRLLMSVLASWPSYTLGVAAGEGNREPCEISVLEVKASGKRLVSLGKLTSMGLMVCWVFR